MNNNCVIYARFSSYGQNEQSIESQIRTCKELAYNKGFNVINTYSDKARTGTNDHRPAFQQMIRDAGFGNFNYIIVYMMDRFARNRRDSIIYKEMLKEKFGIRVISALEPIADDEGGEFYEMFLEWNAEKYSKRLSKRVRDGLDTSVANGIYCGGSLIYGYKIRLESVQGKTNKFIKRVDIDDNEAKVVKFAFEQFDKGFTKKEISQQLNNLGELYRGNPFTFRTFDRILKNEKYTGEFIFGGRQCNNTYPKIIDKQLYIRVQQRLEKNRHAAGGRASAKIPYLLTGKLFCGHCGTDMVSDNGTSQSGKQYRYYSCKKRRKKLCNKYREEKDSLELFVTNCVIDFLDNKKNAEIIADDVIRHYETRTDVCNIKSISARIVNTNKEIEKLTNAFINAKSVLLQNSIEKKMREFEILLKDLEYQQAQLELERGYKITKKDIIDYIELLLQGDKNDKEYQKKIIDNLVKKVFVSDENTVVYLNIKGCDDADIENINFEITEKVRNDVLSVHSHSSPACQNDSKESFFHCRRTSLSNVLLSKTVACDARLLAMPSLCSLRIVVIICWVIKASG